MKTGFVLGLVGVVLGLSFVTHELVQRRRYDVVYGDARAAILAFQARATPQDHGRFESRTLTPDLLRPRARGWDVFLEVPDPPGRRVVQQFQIVVDQERRLILLAPQVHIIGESQMELNHRTLLEQLLQEHGIVYDALYF